MGGTYTALPHYPSLGPQTEENQDRRMSIFQAGIFSGDYCNSWNEALSTLMFIQLIFTTVKSATSMQAWF